MASAASDTSALSSRLHALADGPRTEAARAELLEALHSRFDGLRVLAARALCAWGDAAAIAAVKDAAWGLAGLPNRWGATSAVCQALAPHLTSEADLDWVFALYGGQAHSRTRYFVGAALFEVFAPAALLPRLEALAGRAGDPGWTSDLRAARLRARARLPAG